MSKAEQERKAPNKRTPASGFTPVPADTPETEVSQLPDGTRIFKSELSLLDVRNPDHLTCGAKLPKSDPPKYCSNVPGFRTPHLGTGKCYRHGGLSTGRPIIHGKRSKRFNVNLMEEIQRVMNSPDLLTLNQPIAMMKVSLQRELDVAAMKDEQFRAALDTLEEAGVDITDPGFNLDSFAKFNVDLDLIKTLVMSVRNAYEMQYSKRFSISIKELGAIIGQIGHSFTQLADKYELPPEARRDFAMAIRNLRTSSPAGPIADMQLDAAGTSDDPKQLIEGQVVARDSDPSEDYEDADYDEYRYDDGEDELEESA